MYNVQQSKSWAGMSSEEKVEKLNEDLKVLFTERARQNDLLSELRSENQFLRRLVAIKLGLDEKQIEQVFHQATHVQGRPGGILGNY